MVARVRDINESYKEYKKNLKQEAKLLSVRLKGRLVFTGSTYRKKVKND